MSSQPSPPLDPRYSQHRCHSRLADIVHTLLKLQITETPKRFSLLFQCYASKPGAEPTDVHLIDPATHALRLKSWDGKGNK